MEKKNNIPKLRFPEFSGSWEVKKLGKMAEFKAGYAFKSEQMLSEKNNFQLLKMSNVYKNELRLDRNSSYWESINDKEKEFLLKEGDTILTLTGTVGKQDYGYSIQIKENNKYLLNQRLVLLREIQNISCNDFISQLISNEKFLFYFFGEAKGGTGNQTNVGTEDVKNIQLFFTTLPEQQKIATFLITVDEKLKALKKKKSLLETYKKGVMQKLFSQEIRFKDDEENDFEDWEVKKLREICEIKKGEQLNKEDLTEIGAYPCLNGGINPSGYTEKFNSESNTITISEGGNSCGYINFMTTKFWLGGHCYKIIISKNINNQYLYQLLQFNQQKIMNLRVGSGLPNIQLKDLRNFEVIVYNSIEEQTKIANFLTAIDEKINKIDAQIKQTELWKKGLLQQMFV